MNYKVVNATVAFTVAAVIGVFAYQNCSPVKVTDISQESLSSQLAAKDCVDAGKTEGDKWWVPNGDSRDVVKCAVGAGDQFRVFSEEVEVTCSGGTVQQTGQNRRTDTGRLEGACNLNCNDHANNEMWWMPLPDSTEIKKCPTSLTAVSSIEYRNEAEYRCTSGQPQATSNIKQTVISETPCPPLTFNNQDNVATLVYEDILDQESDQDYNDFVTNVKVQETYNSLEQLTKIQIEYSPIEDLAGYPSKFVLTFDGKIHGRDGFSSNVASSTSLPMFEGAASIQYQLLDSTGNVISTRDSVPKDQDLILFDSGTNAVKNKWKAVVTVTGLAPETNTLSVRKGLSIQRYRTVLFVKACGSGQRYDVDISDINPTMFDANHHPMGFFVPVNWKAPLSGVKIGDVYPDFAKHAEYLYLRRTDPETADSKFWFNNLANPSKAAVSPGAWQQDGCSF